MRILWDERAWDEYLSWQMEDKKTLKKINNLIKDMQRHPLTGIGKPEPLAENMSGWWSRRIDDKNRIVYTEQDGELIIAACRGHYDDK